MSTIQDSPTAAGSGASASKSFKASLAERGAAATSAERVATVVTAVLHGIHEAISEHQVTYPEYQAAKAWMIEVGETGEWPLFLDVFVEHAIEEVASRTQNGTKGTIEGPYYLPGQARLDARASLPRRPGEKGTPLIFTGQVRDIDGTPLAGAEVDTWHADADGYYSGFAPHVPEGNLRGVVDHRPGRPFRDRHHPARALPDPPRRSHRQADRGGRLAPLAAGAPAPDDPRPRAPHHHHTAVLHRR